MKRFAIVLLSCVLMSTSQASVLQKHYDFNPKMRDNQWNGDWQRIPGEPAVPMFTAKILIPYGEELETVRFENTVRTTERTAFPIEITSQPHPLCENIKWDAAVTRKFAPNETYPAKILGDATTVIKHGYRIAYVPLYPLQTYPSTKQASFVAGGDLIVTTRATRAAGLYRGGASDRADVKAMIDNENVLTSYPDKRPGSDMQYLVVGPKEFLETQDGIVKLLAEKKARGITTGTVSLEEIESRGQGRDTQEKIRNSIKEHYEANGVKWVLLVGNGYSILPTKKLRVKLSQGIIPSDFYYACLDDDFTRDDRADLACEVAVGRAPVSNVEELETFVTKSLAMQAVKETDPRVWNVLNAAEKLDGSTLGSKVIEQLATGGKAGSLSTKGYPESANFEKMYETFSSQFSGSQITKKLSDEEFYTVNHLGHANESYCMRFQSSAIPNVETEFFFFGITQGCHPGDLKGPNWASKMVLNPNGGAGAMVANSNYGFYSGNGSSDGPSNRFHLAFYDTVFADGMRDLGHVHFKAKEKLIPQVKTDSIMRWVVYETNLLGDPEIQLKFPK